MESKSVEGIIRGIEGAEKRLAIGLTYHAGTLQCRSSDASVNGEVLTIKKDIGHTFVACSAIAYISVENSPEKHVCVDRRSDEERARHAQQIRGFSEGRVKALQQIGRLARQQQDQQHSNDL